MDSSKFAALTSDHELKIYRQLRNEMVQLKRAKIDAAASNQRLFHLHGELVDLYTTSTSTFKCPTVRFGKTELQMPIITCGGMRMQETWRPGPDVTLDAINKECQENFDKIIQRALELGINHFETARGYGTSEMQYGPLLKKYPRESYILQTKVAPKEDPAEFRALLEKSFSDLQIVDEGFLDLFSFHGVNRAEHIDWITRPGGCLEVIREYQSSGKIKFIGFSTHAMTPVIVAAIETNVFDYVNLHYQFIGSYTATGTGVLGGNAEAIAAATKRDMGIFVISATDKGGGLYEPPMPVYQDCVEDGLTPIAFNNLWIWAHEPTVHTLVVGAARPSDFDEHVQAAMLYPRRHELVAPIARRLHKRVTDMFGEGFLETWFVGLPDAYANTEAVPVNSLYWLWWITKAWGFHRFALKRYLSYENASKNFDYSLSFEESLKKFDAWVPGISFNPSREAQLRDILAASCGSRADHVLAAVKEVHAWLHSGGCIKRGDIPYDPSLVQSWEVAYNLQPNIPFPERPV